MYHSLVAYILILKKFEIEIIRIRVMTQKNLNKID